MAENKQSHQPHRTFVLRILPDNTAHTASYVVRSMPSNTQVVFQSLADALNHIQLAAKS